MPELQVLCPLHRWQHLTPEILPHHYRNGAFKRNTGSSSILCCFSHSVDYSTNQLRPWSKKTNWCPLVVCRFGTFILVQEAISEIRCLWGLLDAARAPLVQLVGSCRLMEAKMVHWEKHCQEFDVFLYYPEAAGHCWGQLTS